MIGLTLVTVVAVLGSGLRGVDQDGRQRPGHRRLRRRRQAGAALPGRRGRHARGRRRASRPPRTSGPTRRSCRARRTRSAGSIPPRSRASTTFDVVEGLRPHARPARDGRRARDQGLRRQRAPEGRRRLTVETPSGDKRHAGDPRDLRPAATKPLLGEIAISQQTFDKAFPQPKNSLTLARRRRRRRGAEIEAPTQRLRRRDVPHGRRVSEGRHEGHGDDARDALRAARLLGDRQPVRDGQHDGALGVRAHP